jgi:hypothetical protein
MISSTRHARALLAIPAALAAILYCPPKTLAADTPTVNVASMDAVGPRAVEEQTKSALIQDYLHAWQTMGTAFDQNRPDVLQPYFVGIARDQLSSTIRDQQSLGIQTLYRDRSHDIRVLFYSPEGLSIQLMDTVDLEIEVRDNGKTVGTQHVRTNYVVLLTPTESKWKVRIIQSGSQAPREAESAAN